MKRCACGCGQPVREGRRFIVRHNLRVAKPDRKLAGHKGRRTHAYRSRARLFARELDALGGRLLTKEQLLDVFKRIYVRGYNSGFCCAARGYQAVDASPVGS